MAQRLRRAHLLKVSI